MSEGECTLCGLPTPDPPVSDEGVDGEFCCRGCLEVARTLGDADVDDAEAAREELDTGASVDDVGGEEAFLAVEGMHCATCEVFLESRAAGHEGVSAAAASYSSSMVRVAYDPDRIDRADLPDLLSGTGYRARDLEDDDDDEESDQVARLLIGGFFGMMVMLWYVFLLYPRYFGVDQRYLLIDLGSSAGQYLLGNVWLMTTVVLAVTGYPLFRGAYVSLRSGHPNMDLLVALAAGTAYVYSTVSVLLGQFEVYYDISVVVVLVVTLGDYYQNRIKERATGRLTELTEEHVSEATRRTGDGTETVPVEDLAEGDELVVGAGERVPLDGTVLDGTAAVDESLVTGESIPVRKESGDEVVGGAVVTDGGLVVGVGEGATSTVDRLLSLLWEIQSTKPGAQRLADRIAAVFVPLVVVVAAFSLGWHLLSGAALRAAILTSLAVLTVSCPCALGLATPLAISSGIREALEAGIVVTDASVFERATETDVVALDKTGTLTTGAMELVDVVGDEAAVRRAAAVEQFADHPVAAAVTDYAAPPDLPVSEFARHPGRGVSAEVDGESVVVGQTDLFEERGWTVPDDLRERYERGRANGRVAALVGWDGRARAAFVAGDRPRPGWEAVVSDLAADHRVVVLTGDGEAAASRFRGHPDVDEVFAGIPPEAKSRVIERLRAEGTVAMVGDGSNDAPALATADLGIALESGTRLAADAADVVLTTDDLAAVPTVFSLTASTRSRIRQNLGWAFLYNAVAIPLAFTGLLNPLFAAVAMAGSSLLVVVNSARTLADGPATARGRAPSATGDDADPPAPDAEVVEG
ncbi:MAG: heavy metal translocating P-type ATPase [Haloferacaceae archaeon]